MDHLNKLAAVASNSDPLKTRNMKHGDRNAPICVGSIDPGVKTCSRAGWRSLGLKYSGVLTSLFNSGLNVAWVCGFCVLMISCEPVMSVLRKR